VKVTSFTGGAAILVGAQAGWIVERHVVIGVAGYGLATNLTPAVDIAREGGTNRIGFGYGGARLGFVFAPERIVHVNFGMLIGGGGVTVVTRDSTSGRLDSHDGAAVFALEPQTELELNVTHYMRIATSVSYRFIGDTGKPGLESSDLSGVAAGLAVRIGFF
jgi:hypothetical protein